MLKYNNKEKQYNNLVHHNIKPFSTPITNKTSNTNNNKRSFHHPMDKQSMEKRATVIQENAQVYEDSLIQKDPSSTRIIY